MYLIKVKLSVGVDLFRHIGCKSSPYVVDKVGIQMTDTNVISERFIVLKKIALKKYRI